MRKETWYFHYIELGEGWRRSNFNHLASAQDILAVMSESEGFDDGMVVGEYIYIFYSDQGLCKYKKCQTVLDTSF